MDADLAWSDVLTWFAWLVLPAFLLLDFVHGARHFWTPAWWRTRALAVSAVAVGTSVLVAALWSRAFEGIAILPGHRLGFLGGAAVGVLAYEFCHYWLHRAAHAWTPLWRAFHQLHHSAESLDAYGAYFRSPLEVAMYASLQSLLLFPVLGLTLEAALGVGAFTAFSAVFQHANLRTPRWLGYLVQRPESHAVHHERGVHRWNYADLPLWDLAFGTLRNPARWAGRVGFYRGASARLGELLIGVDVSAPRENGGSPARAPRPDAAPASQRPSAAPASQRPFVATSY
jgi:sterol desaturase/sphingolipid hydroxylase (fatty acid hydroxylase superfamily)